MIRDKLQRLAAITWAPAQANVPGPAWMLGYGKKFWALVLPVALVSGAFAPGLKLLLRLVEHLAWGYRAGEMTTAAAGTSALHRVAVLALAGVMTGAGWWALKRVAGTTGGGMNGQIWSRRGEMALVPTLVTAALSMTVIAMGAFIGREQPLKERSAALACALAKRAGLTTQERCLLMACAAGGGWAAVYNQYCSR